MTVESTLTLDVQHMSCASCVGRVEKTALSVEGVVTAVANLPAENIQVSHNKQLDVEALVHALTDAGYKASLATSDTQTKASDKDLEIRQLGHQALIALVFALPVFLLEMGSHLFPAVHDVVNHTIGQQNSRLFQWLLTTLVLFGPGLQFYKRGFPALIKGSPEMNSLVALGTSAAYFFSVIATVVPQILPQGADNVYFESAAVIVVLILAGRYMEARAKGKTGEAIVALMNLQVNTARVARNNEIEEVAIEQLVPDDIVHVRPGERVPLDGVIIDGHSFVDESMITGESVPVEKCKDAIVIGGTINNTGAFRFRVSRVANESTLAQIIDLVQKTQNSKLPIQSLVDKITARFVPAVMAVAALTFAAWFFSDIQPVLGNAVVATVAVLIIACPCAMGLATPTSIMVASGVSAKMGILFRQGEALQTLRNVTVIATDKTGTLTKGCMEISHVCVSEDVGENTMLQLVASAESQSEHPVAQAIVRAAQEKELTLLTVEKFNSVSGLGVRATVAGKEILVGADRLFDNEGIDISAFRSQGKNLNESGMSSLYVAIEGYACAVLAVSDQLKPDSGPTIRALQERGLQVVMITGDNEATAHSIAQELGITEIYAQVLPADKARTIQSMQHKGHKVAFVGDGINDAPALAQADTGIAIGTGADVAIEAADVVLMAGELKGINDAFHISQQTLKNIRQNLVWAFGYNILLIPVAAGLLFPVFGIMLSPMLAAGAMAISSILVLTNALRLRWLSSPKI
ncbi:MAG: heavy metal translocating P-type ATPase [Granulosicoccus sp.]